MMCFWSYSATLEVQAAASSLFKRSLPARLDGGGAASVVRRVPVSRQLGAELEQQALGPKDGAHSPRGGHCIGMVQGAAHIKHVLIDLHTQPTGSQ